MVSQIRPAFSHFSYTSSKLLPSNSTSNQDTTEAMKFVLIVLVLCSLVKVTTASSEINGIFRLPHLLNPRQAPENVSAAIGVCLGDGVFECPYVNSNILACYYPKISDPKDQKQATQFQICLCNPKPRKEGVPAFQDALQTCLSCLRNNTLTATHATQIQSVYTNFCAADKDANIAAFLEEEPVLMELQNSWGFVSFYTDGSGKSLLTDTPILTKYAGPTTTISTATASSSSGTGSNTTTAEATPSPTVSGSATATETGTRAGVGRVKLESGLLGFVGVVGLWLAIVR
ncbi:MAG: hypothetical protein M1836_001045 [Candelina mexicana]|nr:MAG: hypothetical protein M1836_001045 [Candelina mexicana]